jgi:predicted TIM-barrel fold metal-dependent hydrolase
MGLVVNAHTHISNEEPGHKYFPWQHTWFTCMSWAYGIYSPTMGAPPYDRDPNALYPKQGLRFADPEGIYTIAAMDEAGIDVGVILPIDYDWSWGSESAITLEDKHRHQAEMVRRYPGRFVAFGGPDPRRPGAAEIFERSIVEYDFRGLKLLPKVGYYPWDEQVYPLYEVCRRHDLPVFVCTEPDGGGYNRDRFAEPIHLSDVIADYPDLSIVLLHAGEPQYHYFEEALLVASRAANAYLEVNFWIRPHFVSNIIPSYKDDEEAVLRLLARARNVVGAHRILWGVDGHAGPRLRPDSRESSDWKGPVEWLRSLPELAPRYGLAFAPSEIDMILGENAARLVGISDNWPRPHSYSWHRRLPAPFRGM